MLFRLHVLSTLLLLSFASALQNFDTWAHERVQLSDVSIHFRYSDSGKPPLLLVHGFPQHSLTWSTIGPILAQKYTVIAVDNRGAGDSSLSATANYTAQAGGEDLRAVLDFLYINKTYVFAHDKGVGLATSLALEHPELVERLVLAEYALPGFGYSACVTSPDLYMNWQLALFAVPDAAQYFIQGREKEMLAWYFWHASYSGDDSISNDVLETYTRAISKPGFLRAGMQYFAAAFQEAGYFQGRINSTGKLRMPLLGLGGEASFGSTQNIQELFSPFAADLTTDVIPKAGHWIGDENPEWTANRVLQFLSADNRTIPSVDLTYLQNRTSVFGALGSTEVSFGTNRSGPPF